MTGRCHQVESLSREIEKRAKALEKRVFKSPAKSPANATSANATDKSAEIFAELPEWFRARVSHVLLEVSRSYSAHHARAPQGSSGKLASPAVSRSYSPARRLR